ncbi:MAG: hypothetical protein BroJett011_62450 [Chloroflexota bacterium]|nr:MAG: hypothetical protein BroJett011_62450 [Chloroflexota bacterium]
METRLCKRGHKMTRVGRGDKKRWVCNKCRSASRRANASGSRRGRRLSYDVSWSAAASVPAVNASYYDRPAAEEEETR